MADIQGNESPIAKKRLRYELDWDRMIYVDDTIDEALVRKLAPEIIRLKRKSSDPITVAIDSEGGQVRSLESLLGLLESPDQRGNRCPFYTVAVNRAQSAAASLLAFGDYSVAFSHSQILFHPHWRRLSSGLSATEAIGMARDLKESDEILALRLAERVLHRKCRCFGSLEAKNRFAEATKAFPTVAAEYRQQISHGLTLLGCADPDIYEIDFVGFATALWAELSTPLDRQLVGDALVDLVRLLEFRELMTHLREGGIGAGGARKADTSARAKLSRAFELACTTVGGPEAAGRLGPEYVAQRMTELERLVSVFLMRAAKNDRWRPESEGFSQLEEDYVLLESFEEYQGNRQARDVMWNNLAELLSQEAIDGYNATEGDARKALHDTVVRPQSDFFWLFHVMMCRRLLADENRLTPTEAQLLGLVEEVLGGGAVMSRGELELQEILSGEDDDEGAAPDEEEEETKEPTAGG